jgi:hypothetical protein
MRGKRFRPSRAASSPVPVPVPPDATPLTAEQLRHEFHSRSDPIPARSIRTVLIDVSTDTQRGFWDAPFWLPVGGVIEGGDDLWEVVSVRLRLPTASIDDFVRPVLYLYARRAEA